MPRYVLERTYDVNEKQLPTVATRPKRIAQAQFPTIVWEHSHVVVDDDGTLKSFCVYEAPDIGTVRRHAEVLGNHVVDHIYEIGGDVTPADFPL